MPRERPELKHLATSFAAERSLLIQFWRRYRRVIGEEERQGTLGIEWCGSHHRKATNCKMYVCDDTAKNRRTRVAKNWHVGDTQERQQGQRQRQYTIEEDLMDQTFSRLAPEASSRRLRTKARLIIYVTTLVRKHAIGSSSTIRLRRDQRQHRDIHQHHAIMLGIFAAFSMSIPAVPLRAE